MKQNNSVVEKLYNKLCNIIKEYHPSDDNTLIYKAFEMAKKAHGNQQRKSGEPFIIHPLNVSIILAELRLDKETIIAALLHDVIEDTNVTSDQIQKIFGSEILFLIEGVTKIEKLSSTTSKDELKSESFRKLFLAMARDVRVIIIKLADRLHNMRTLEFQSPEKQIEISQETLDIYAPIAQKLGISVLSYELEDLALKYLAPEDYYNISQKISETSFDRESRWNQIVSDLKNILTVNNLNAKIVPQLKHIFSIYRKMVTQNVNIEELYDIYAIEIIVANIYECYVTLGLIHQVYNPVPGRFKDYIAIPKPNMYQSLHTTLVSKRGEKFEVQIKTFQMEQTAKYGVLVNWKYEVRTTKEILEITQKEKTQWLEQILEWQLEFKNNNEFMELIKSDFNLFSKTIYCFTRNGDVRHLPKGSTAIDFAYSIHSDIGNHIDKVLVNGKIESPQYVLKNGDQIEIFTSSTSETPNQDWLKYVKTSNAKNKIRKWIKSHKNN